MSREGETEQESRGESEDPPEGYGFGSVEPPPEPGCHFIHYRPLAYPPVTPVLLFNLFDSKVA